jgi:hypothetical protein
VAEASLVSTGASTVDSFSTIGFSSTVGFSYSLASSGAAGYGMVGLGSVGGADRLVATSRTSLA